MSELEANKWCRENRVIISFADPHKVKIMWGHAGGGEVEAANYLDAVVLARAILEPPKSKSGE